MQLFWLKIKKCNTTFLSKKDISYHKYQLQDIFLHQSMYVCPKLNNSLELLFCNVYHRGIISLMLYFIYLLEAKVWRVATSFWYWLNPGSFTNRDYQNRHWDYCINNQIHPCKTKRCNYSSMPWLQRRCNHTTVEVRAWVSKYIPQKMIDVITYSYSNVFNHRRLTKIYAKPYRSSSINCLALNIRQGMLKMCHHWPQMCL